MGVEYDARGFNWLLAELDEDKRTAFGWVCLNNLQNAEWGYVWLPEVQELGARPDEHWIPIAFKEAKRLVLGYMEKPSTKYHYDWWRHENQEKMEREYEGLWDNSPAFDFQRFMEKAYKFQFGLGGD